MSESRSPAVGPWGIPDELGADVELAGAEVVDVELAGVELAAGADDEELVDDAEPELEPQPATSRAIATSAALSSCRTDKDLVLLIMVTSVVVSVSRPAW